jgi:predicted dehydrogenase
VISHPQVNAVIVSTSEHEHLEPVMQALALGKPVLVEKPIALTLADADQIIAKAEDTGTPIRVGYAQRFKRRYISAKDQIVEGREITALTGRACNTRAQGIEILKRSPRATPVVDVLTYWVDVAGWFLEGIRPREVTARGNGTVFRQAGFDVNDASFAIITYENAWSISRLLCTCCAQLGMGVRIYGSEGMMLNDDHTDELLIARRAFRTPIFGLDSDRIPFLVSRNRLSDYWACTDETGLAQFSHTVHARWRLCGRLARRWRSPVEGGAPAGSPWEAEDFRRHPGNAIVPGLARASPGLGFASKQVFVNIPPAFSQVSFDGAPARCPPLDQFDRAKLHTGPTGKRRTALIPRGTHAGFDQCGIDDSTRWFADSGAVLGRSRLRHDTSYDRDDREGYVTNVINGPSAGYSICRTIGRAKPYRCGGRVGRDHRSAAGLPRPLRRGRWNGGNGWERHRELRSNRQLLLAANTSRA